MTEITSTEIVLPTTGEIVDIKDPQAMALALNSLRFVESEIRECKSFLSRAFAEEAAVRGTRTFDLQDGRKAVVSSGSETVYDSEAIMDGLAAAGMPMERVMEVVEEVVTYRVKAVEAKRAAAANAAYATVIDENSREVEKPVTVSIRRS